MKRDRTGELWWRGPLDRSQNSHYVKLFVVIGPGALTTMDDGFQIMRHPVIVLDPPSWGRHSSTWEERSTIDWDKKKDEYLLAGEGVNHEDLE